MKLWYQSKTVWVNIISILIYFLTTLSVNPALQFSTKTLTLFGVILGVLNLILRIYFTDTPITTSAPTDTKS